MMKTKSAGTIRRPPQSGIDGLRSLILAPEGKPAPIYSRSDSPRLSIFQKATSSVNPSQTPNSDSPRATLAPDQAATDGDGTITPNSPGKLDIKKKDVVIHVYDENRNAKRDFYCKQYLLLREMKFFSYLADKASTTNQIDIDVHCDIEVFEWLMMFITRQRPALEPRSVVSILISSNFLQMASLQDICLEYIHDHINEIIKVPIDMNCICKSLLVRLAKLFSLSELNEIVDPKDKLISKLHMHKVTEILTQPKSVMKSSPERTITPKTHYVSPPSQISQPIMGEEDELPIVFRKCKHCYSIYPKHEEANLKCDEGVLAINFRGEINSTHERLENFNFNEWIVDLLSEGIGWKGVLWRVWGLVYHADCVACKKRFPFSEYPKCRRHIENVVYPHGVNSSDTGSDTQRGKYLCCGEAMYRFNPFRASKGCSMTPHVLDESVKSSKLFHIFESHMDLISPPMSHCLNLESNSETPDTIQTINNVRCFRILGAWNEEIYNTPSFFNRKPMTYPIGFNKQTPYEYRSIQVVPSNLTVYMQREEDALRMQAIIKQCASFRKTSSIG